MRNFGPILTVRQALEMPVFSEARLVAGAGGLENRIRWAHITDVPDPHYEWGRAGILLLTTGLGFEKDNDRQTALVPRLVDHQFAGMVLCVGHYLDHTPPPILEAADKMNFPVIEVPPHVLFVNITQAVFERIIHRQYALLQESDKILNQLTRLVLQNSNLDRLAETLAGLLQRSITIEDSSFQLLASAQQGQVDEARVRSVVRRRTTPEVAQRLIDQGIYDQTCALMRPVHVPPMPDFEMTMERIIAPIIVDQEVHGYIWIISGDRPLTDLDELAITHGATVAALILFKEKAQLEAEAKLRGDFFKQLCEPQTESADLLEKAHRLNFQLNRSHQVLLIHSQPEAGTNIRSLYRAVETWFRARTLNPLLVWREDGLVIVVESGDYNTGKQIGGCLVNDLSHPADRLLVGVGDPVLPVNGECAGIPHSYEQALEAIRVGLVLGKHEGVVVFHELGLLHWLYHLPVRYGAENIYLQHILTLAEHDRQHDRELLKSLESYLDCGGSLVDAAHSLYVHRNTLLHRISRVESLSGLDLRDPLVRTNLHAALKYYRLNQE